MEKQYVTDAKTNDLVLAATLPKILALKASCPQSVGFYWDLRGRSFDNIFLMPLLDVEFGLYPAAFTSKWPIA